MATQYAKAMGLKVVGLDINESALAAVRELGADATFNTKSDGNYLEKLKQLTGGGLHGLVFVSNAHAAFAPALDTLRTNGIMMVTGVPIKDLPINAMDLVTGRYRIKGGRPGVPHEMKDAVEFTAKHGIVPKMVFYRLDEINTMIELMKKGEVGGGRMGVDFSNESDFPREAKL
jgi:D-arabinose 1-dehydrogenase-like Zn-dependent alcohol dehydrogenase